MKHYTQFLPKKTLRMVQIGKQINALNFDIEETERKLKRLTADRNELETEIFTKVSFYNGFGTMETINTAKEKAENYNNVRLMNKPPNQ